ncbi:MAG: TIR domain-containing protein [Asticcacaulis sp.]|uniref:TIR domain-containing protein n=1 Tax=Asticcacaulis sp. TaxID=1872648 RepID=UPI003F7CC0AB
MIEKYTGDKGKRLRVESLASQRTVMNAAGLAEALETHIEPLPIAKGAVLIQQDADDDDVFFIFSGSFKIEVNGRQVSTRGRDDTVGEMAALEPGQKRSATVTALEDSVVGKISEAKFNEIAAQHGQLYKFIAKQLARRLLERNKHVGVHRDQIKVFIISSKEALHIARAVKDEFEHDPFIVQIWTNDVFRIGRYTLDDLEVLVDDSDFAIAIAHADDVVISRDDEWPAARDNVVFELGLFMGRLGKERTILLEPRDAQLKLPSDMRGITNATYSLAKGGNLSTALGTACNQMRTLFHKMGPYNG